jgi:hypothetical protein
LKRLLILALLLMVPPAFGAISIIQHVHNHVYTNGATVTCTLSSTGASRNIIVGAMSATSGAGAVSVSSVADNQLHTFVQASGSRGVHAGNLHGSEIWHALNVSAGVTTVTVTFSGEATSYWKACFAYEVSGTVTFDTAAKVDTGTCVTLICTGASVTTATTTGFVLGVIVVDPVDQNPNSGNEFTSGGDTDTDGNGAAVSLISSTAAAHQPVWHGSVGADTFTSSTAAYKQ